MKRYIKIISGIVLMFGLVFVSGCSATTSYNNLFDEVYLNIAKREVSHKKSDLMKHLEEEGFEVEEDLDFNSINVYESEDVSGDYVYIMFEVDEDSSEEAVKIYSYYRADEEIEVQIENSSSGRKPEEDLFRTQKIGEEREEVNSIKDQIKFLKEATNESKIDVNNDRIENPSDEGTEDEDVQEE